MATLNDYTHIRTAVYVKMEIAEYWNGTAFEEQIIGFSDDYADLVFDNVLYTALGNLMSVTSTFSDLESTSDTVTIVLSGIPNRSIEEIVKSKIKSAPVTIYRGFFNADGSVINDLDIDNLLLRFEGYVNNYSLQEDWDAETRTASNTIAIDVGSKVDVLQRKVSGRKTNPVNMARYYPSDKSFDNVPALVDQKVNFGQ